MRRNRISADRHFIFSVKIPAYVLLSFLIPAGVFAAQPVPPVALTMPDAGGWRYADIRRVPAPEARQGVAADDDFLYIISNHALGKYRKDTGVRVASWECPEGEPRTHLNAGIVYKGRLYCAHSNYPGVPNLSSVEIWDTETLRQFSPSSLLGEDRRAFLTGEAQRDDRIDPGVL